MHEAFKAVRFELETQLRTVFEILYTYWCSQTNEVVVAWADEIGLCGHLSFIGNINEDFDRKSKNH